MTYLVTGAAGFIGYHTALRLLEAGETVVGIDNLSPYYSVELKRERLDELRRFPAFTFHEVDLADRGALAKALAGVPIRRIIHLAAQAGVRYSLEHPEEYVSANLAGHVEMLEFHRSRREAVESMVYASSSSVYGGNTKMPFAESDPVDRPVSLYAATKRADELMSHTYAHLFGLRLTGLRFFTVYGPSGRPDMAMWIFTEAILAGKPIQVFNYGKMQRDFTYIDDIVTGVLAVAARPPTVEPPHRVYNIGNNRPEEVMHVIELIEEATGRKAEKELLPLQPGDVPATYADITALSTDYGFRPTTPIEVGIPRFVEWFLRRRH
ncbi:MAG: NAD-dependent epimerase/dehydratase family protein [Bauldia sp.]|nr:NAD-dependent epimerase/dehydratase family protein [Bauldia sp.]